MSVKRTAELVCDRCKKPMGALPDGEEPDRGGAPVFISIVIDGVEQVSWVDVCDRCKATTRANVDRILKRAPKKAKKAAK